MTAAIITAAITAITRIFFPVFVSDIFILLLLPYGGVHIFYVLNGGESIEREKRTINFYIYSGKMCYYKIIIIVIWR